MDHYSITGLTLWILFHPYFFLAWLWWILLSSYYCRGKSCENSTTKNTSITQKMWRLLSKFTRKLQFLLSIASFLYIAKNDNVIGNSSVMGKNEKNLWLDYNKHYFIFIVILFFFNYKILIYFPLFFLMSSL